MQSRHDTIQHCQGSSAGKDQCRGNGNSLIAKQDGDESQHGRKAASCQPEEQSEFCVLLERSLHKRQMEHAAGKDESDDQKQNINSRHHLHDDPFAKYIRKTSVPEREDIFRKAAVKVRTDK